MLDDSKSHRSLYGAMEKIPGGLMIVPMIIGSIFGTFCPTVLDAGSFTSALFRDGALPLMGLLLFATGMQLTVRTLGQVASTTGVLLTCKSIIPGLLVIGLGYFCGLDGIFGISLIALLAAMDNNNGGVWVAFAGKYGDRRDQGAYIASVLNDGPFFSMVLIGAAGFAVIPLDTMLAALFPVALGVLVGNLDCKWRTVMEPVANVTIPFIAFGLGIRIDLFDILKGGLTGIGLGIAVVAVTGTLVYAGYRFLLKRGEDSAIGFAAGTTSGNAIANPAILAAIDPALNPYVGVATAQVAASALVTALLAPTVAAWLLGRARKRARTRQRVAPPSGAPAPSASGRGLS
ncbi:2-keto-3-deoxygluconate permease [Pantoea sp. Ap-967]|uniref:2-keto-3-deoxygluconate permease n=1 Tax=Pantoea sp. Ap-967 TaxID=2608362 RepID=UPI00142291A3|nr:2-keto-3-deoxygluconate permease [Pantoea sp. Ap-967]NIE73308.1 2-keto-3-deoxygluconate permease [Pantoea sp. Ap-967]